MIRPVRSFRLADPIVAGIVLVTIAALGIAWYVAAEAVPVSRMDVGGQRVEIGIAPGAAVEFRAPQGWARVATGDRTLGRLVTGDGGLLLVRITPGVTDFDGAAPRRLRELREMGIDAQYTEALHTSRFSGRLCRAEASGRGGICAFVVDDQLGATLVALPGRAGHVLDVPALIDGMRKAE